MKQASVSVAPMMEWTDRHCRFFLRLISRRVRLYSEMVTTAALVHGDRKHLLMHHPAEYPLALQLGGSEPDELARCAAWGEQSGYTEVNLNVGCPSDRVQSGRFGACLMLEPELVAECLSAMRSAVSIPVTLKTRIGVDRQDDYRLFHAFVDRQVDAGLEYLIVHARKAWLDGLSPRENREIPPLRYEWVYRIKQEFPALRVDINGGIRSLGAICEHLNHVDGVMIGREAYHNPYLLAGVDQLLEDDAAVSPTRREVVEQMLPYIHRHLEGGGSLQQIARHMLGLFHAQPGARAWRRYISENAWKKGAGSEVIVQALEKTERPVGR